MRSLKMSRDAMSAYVYDVEENLAMRSWWRRLLHLPAPRIYNIIRHDYFADREEVRYVIGFRNVSRGHAEMIAGALAHEVDIYVPNYPLLMDLWTAARSGDDREIFRALTSLARYTSVSEPR